MRGSVSAIESLGAVDGPGLRTVVFLNGCHLRCKYCHNPEMWQESQGNMTVDELVERIMRNKAYFKNGGGVTFSGGEPTLQTSFLIPVCQKLHSLGIHIALDTAGYTTNYALLDYVDLVIMDIKDVTPERFRELTTGDIQLSENFLAEIKKRHKKLWLRQVVVPGRHDNGSYIKMLASYIHKHCDPQDIERIEFLPYHKLGSEKYATLKIPYPCQNINEMDPEICQKWQNEFTKIYNNNE